MDLLNYNTDPGSALNQLRLQLWCAKEVLAEANRTKDNEMKRRAMRYINKDREALRNLAHKIRAKLPAQEVYRVELKGEAIRFAEYEWAHSQSQANRRVMHRHNGEFQCITH